MDDLRASEHQVLIINRERIAVQGVLHVDSFDESEIVLETDLGLLSLQGEELRIKQLDVDNGRLEVEGIMKTMDYLEDVGLEGVRKRSKGLIARIFK